MTTQINTYNIGAQVRIAGILASAAGILTDPSTLVAKVTSPDGTTTTYTYGSSAYPVRVSAGTYYVDVTPDISGNWAYRFQSGGTGQGVGEGRFYVRMSRVGS